MLLVGLVMTGLLVVEYSIHTNHTWKLDADTEPLLWLPPLPTTPPEWRKRREETVTINNEHSIR